VNRQSMFAKKVAYVITIGLLLIPLFWLSHPATRGSNQSKGSPGGKLAQLRQEYGISRGQLGEIDPAGEAIKLATLGLRPFAVNLLWQQADEYKTRKDFSNLSATLNQIVRLQPNFYSVWNYLAWELSYNVSVEFDDYRDRYHWLMRGVEFLKEGTKYNQRDPRLLRDIGRFISRKIGRADEHKQFRRLFKEDDEFHGSRPLALRDNWLVGKEWFRKAEEMVDTQDVTIKGTSTLLFRSEAPLCQMSYADALEKDGIFGEVAQRAWKRATQDWDQYGSLDIPTTYGDGIIIRLNDKELYQQLIKELDEKLDALEPGLRKKIDQERLDTLTPNHRKALDTPEQQRTEQQHILASQAEAILEVTQDDIARRIASQAKAILEVTQDDVARRIEGAKVREARKLAKEAAEHKKMVGYIRNYRDIVNFEYWRLRAQVEQTDEAVTARELIYKAEKALEDADLEAATENFDKGFAAWRKVLDMFPDLASNQLSGDDLMEMIRKYQLLREQDNKVGGLPKDFPLRDIIRIHGNDADRKNLIPEDEEKDPTNEVGKSPAGR